MRAFGALARLRFREALAGRVLWLVPLHFLLSLLVARGVPGPTTDLRREAADAAALGLAALLALLAAVVLGAGPLPAERGKARGALILAAPPSATARVLGSALGSGGALILLLLTLQASALGAVEVVLGAPPLPRAWTRAASLEGGEADGRDPGLRWARPGAAPLVAAFPAPLPGDAELELRARPRVGREGDTPGLQRAVLRFLPGPAGETLRRVTVPIGRPFRVRAPAGTREVKVDAVPGNFDLGLRAGAVRADAGPRPRAAARGLHATALAGGLAAALAAALALSTVVGSGVAAAGAGALAFLALLRPVFADAAVTLASAGALETALGADSGGGGHAHGAISATPPALAPLFRGLAALLPDGGRFDLSATVAANEVPDPGDAGGALLLGLLLAALFLAAALPGARRRP